MSRDINIDEMHREVAAKVWQREGDNLIFDPCTLETPLSKLMDAEGEVERVLRSLDPDKRLILEDYAEKTLDEYLTAVRVATMQVLFDWLFGGGITPRAVLKRLFAFVRVQSPDHLWMASQQDVADLFGETRAAVCDREKVSVEAFLRLWARKDYTASRGGKSAAARETYAKLRKGNNCRKGGKKTEHLFKGKEKTTNTKDKP